MKMCEVLMLISLDEVVLWYGLININRTADIDPRRGGEIQNTQRGGWEGHAGGLTECVLARGGDEDAGDHEATGDH